MSFFEVLPSGSSLRSLGKSPAASTLSRIGTVLTKVAISVPLPFDDRVKSAVNSQMSTTESRPAEIIHLPSEVMSIARGTDTCPSSTAQWLPSARLRVEVKDTQLRVKASRDELKGWLNVDRGRGVVNESKCQRANDSSVAFEGVR